MANYAFVLYKNRKRSIIELSKCYLNARRCDMYYDFGDVLANVFTGATVVGWVIGIILLLVFLAMIRWKIFVKAGEKGWKSLIPIYGTYTEYKLVWDGKWYWFQFIAGLISGFAVGIPLIGPTLFFASLIFLTVFRVILAMQESYAFNKGDGFAIGLMTFKFVFQILLAFDNDIKYVGPQPTPDFFGKVATSIGERAGGGEGDTFGENDENGARF